MSNTVYGPWSAVQGAMTTSGAGVIIPEAYGGKPDGSNSYQALAKAAAASHQLGLPMFLSKGNWYSGGGGWAGVPLLSGVEVYGEPGTICTWDSGQWGYPMFDIAGGSSGVSIHDLTFQQHGGSAITSGAAAVNATHTNPQASNIHIYNCNFDAACINNLFGCSDSLIENCNMNGALTRATLAQTLAPGTIYSSVQIEPLVSALGAGAFLYVYFYPQGIFKPGTFQAIVTSAAAPVGATLLPVKPFMAEQSLPAGSLVQQIVVSTGFAMTGSYEQWSTATPGPGGVWVNNSTIQGCKAYNCNAADIFINMGYKCFIQDSFGWVGHDMNFDFEYCVQSIMQRNEGHYGGNRGCAVETINSECQVLDNDIYDVVGESGVRVTTDYVPAKNPYTVGGHIVKGNKIRRCGWGITFQGTWGTIDSNDVQENQWSGIHLENAFGPTPATDFVTVTGNAITYNYGCGVDLLNTNYAVIDDTNEIAFNGYLGTVAPLRTAPVLSLGSVAASTLTSGEEFMVALAWQADVPSMGTIIRLTGPASRPGFITTTAANQTIQASVKPPQGVSGVAVYVAPRSWFEGPNYVNNYLKPSTDFHANALILGGPRLGYVDTQGNATYEVASMTTGLSATVASDGTLNIVISAPATGGFLFRQYNNGSGVWINSSTGGVSNCTIAANMHDNGYAGLWGYGTGMVLGGGSSATNVSNHTALVAMSGRGLKGGLTAKNVQASGTYLGIVGGVTAEGGSIAGCEFSNIATDCIRYEGPVGSQSFGFTIDGCKFGVSGPCGTGIYIDATIPVFGWARATPGPGVVSNCQFLSVTTPIDENGGTQNVLTIGAGNVGLPPA